MMHAMHGAGGDSGSVLSQMLSGGSPAGMGQMMAPEMQAGPDPRSAILQALEAMDPQEIMMLLSLLGAGGGAAGPGQQMMG